MHTPGPWAYDADSREIFADSDGFGWIALVKGNERLANANLIAAAPAMLEALRSLVDYFGPDVDNALDEALTSARAAIERATTED